MRTQILCCVNKSVKGLHLLTNLIIPLTYTKLSNTTINTTKKGDIQIGKMQCVNRKEIHGLGLVLPCLAGEGNINNILSVK